MRTWGHEDSSSSSCSSFPYCSSSLSYSSSYSSFASLMSSVSLGANRGHTKTWDLLQRPVDQLRKLSGNCPETVRKHFTNWGQAGARRWKLSVGMCIATEVWFPSPVAKRRTNSWRCEENKKASVKPFARLQSGGRERNSLWTNHCTCGGSQKALHFFHTLFSFLFFSWNRNWVTTNSDKNVFQGWASSQSNRKSTKNSFFFLS